MDASRRRMLAQIRIFRPGGPSGAGGEQAVPPQRYTAEPADRPAPEGRGQSRERDRRA